MRGMYCHKCHIYCAEIHGKAHTFQIYARHPCGGVTCAALLLQYVQ